MAEDSSDLLDALAEVLTQDAGSLERLFLQRTVAPALEHIRLSSVAAARAGSRAAGAHGFLSLEAEDLLVDRARHMGRGLAQKLLQTTPKVQVKVAELELLSPAERSHRVAVDSALWHPAAVRALLDLEEAMGEGPHAERESWILLAAELAERMAYRDFPVTLIADLRAAAWSRLSELLLEQRETGEAEFTMRIAHAHLPQGTGDPDLVYQVNLRWALLLWAQGRSSETLLVLRTVQMLAAASRDDARLGSADLWLSAFHRQCGEEGLAREAQERAAGRLGSELLSALSQRQETLLERLGLRNVQLDSPGQNDPEP
jgi:hypothetical protein